MAHPEIIRQGWIRGNALHNFLVFLYHLARVPLPLCAMLVTTMVGVAALAFERPAIAGGILGLAVLLDLGLLILLPARRLSFGWIQPPWLMFTCGRVILALVFVPLGATLQQLLVGGLQLTLTLLSWYGSLVEPFRIQHTELAVPVRSLQRPISVLLLTDLHMERMTVREEAALDAIARRKPELILLGGDLLNLSYVGDPTAIDEARSFLTRLYDAPAGTYFVRGTVDIDPPAVARRILEGLPITTLEDEVATIEHAGATIQLVGLPADRSHAELVGRLRELPARSPSICLHHTPDLVEEASRLDFDLYLAGHTHGGQICLPLVGPLATASRFGRRYVRGRHQLGATTAYISRGLGLEGLGAPRMRFLARPELVWIELVPHPA